MVTIVHLTRLWQKVSQERRQKSTERRSYRNTSINPREAQCEAETTPSALTKTQLEAISTDKITMQPIPQAFKRISPMLEAQVEQSTRNDQELSKMLAVEQ